MQNTKNKIAIHRKSPYLHDFFFSSKSAEQAIIDDIVGSDRAVNAALYQTYANNLRRAIDRVFAQDDSSGLSDRLRANVSRFAAYKAYHATRLARQAAAEPDGDPRRVLHTFNRYQAAEYNTTVSRSRTAKQWGEFADADHLRLFPNLRWLPSRSATPREEHVRFYNRVWAKTDPFWQQNQPGNLWNCKCDWEETDDPCTTDNPTTPIRHNGLEGNPALTGQVFTDNHAYMSKAGGNRKERDKVEMACENADKTITIKKAVENLSDKISECKVGTQSHRVEFIRRGISHYCHDLGGQENIYWVKNEILPNIDKYLKNAQYIGRKVCDRGHNVNKETLRLKRQTNYFYYFKIKLPNEEYAYLHLGMYNEMKVGKAGTLYLYSISKNIPKEIENQ